MGDTQIDVHFYDLTFDASGETREVPQTPKGVRQLSEDACDDALNYLATHASR